MGRGERGRGAAWEKWSGAPRTESRGRWEGAKKSPGRYLPRVVKQEKKDKPAVRGPGRILCLGSAAPRGRQRASWPRTPSYAHIPAAPRPNQTLCSRATNSWLPLPADPLQDGGDRDRSAGVYLGTPRPRWGKGGEAGSQRPGRCGRARPPAPGPKPAPPPTHQDALTSSSSPSLRAWYWNLGRPPAPPPPPPRSRGAAVGAWAPSRLGPAPSSSGPWPPRRRLASGGAGKDREVLILPVKRWYREAMGPRARAGWRSAGRCSTARSAPGRPRPTPAGGRGDSGGEEGERQPGGPAAPPPPCRRHRRAPGPASCAPSPRARVGVWGRVLLLFPFRFFQLLATATRGRVTDTRGGKYKTRRGRDVPRPRAGAPEPAPPERLSRRPPANGAWVAEGWRRGGAGSPPAGGARAAGGGARVVGAG